jgi:two-component system sensor histidine kinase EvgS
MDQALLERCFRPFEQAAGAHGGRDQGGTGLGLAISSQLVQAMGGALVATSKPAEGSRFTATLPFVQPASSV